MPSVPCRKRQAVNVHHSTWRRLDRWPCCPWSTRDSRYLPHSFQGSFFPGNHQKPEETGGLSKRTMVDKNGESTPREMGLISRLQVVRGVSPFSGHPDHFSGHPGDPQVLVKLAMACHGHGYEGGFWVVSFWFSWCPRE